MPTPDERTKLKAELASTVLTKLQSRIEAHQHDVEKSSSKQIESGVSLQKIKLPDDQTAEAIVDLGFAAQLEIDPEMEGETDEEKLFDAMVKIDGNGMAHLNPKLFSEASDNLKPKSQRLVSNLLTKDVEKYNKLIVSDLVKALSEVVNATVDAENTRLKTARGAAANITPMAFKLSAIKDLYSHYLDIDDTGQVKLSHKFLTTTDHYDHMYFGAKNADLLGAINTAVAAGVEQFNKENKTAFTFVAQTPLADAKNTVKNLFKPKGT